jgi:hypothetical protein
LPTDGVITSNIAGTTWDDVLKASVITNAAYVSMFLLGAMGEDEVL